MTNERTPSAVSKATWVVGYHVAIALRQDLNGLTCYVGRVVAIDTHGVRLTLVDWFTGMFNGADFFVPWDLIGYTLVATPEDNLNVWGEEAKSFQNHCQVKAGYLRWNADANDYEKVEKSRKDEA